MFSNFRYNAELFIFPCLIFITVFQVNIIIIPASIDIIITTPICNSEGK